MRYFHRTCAHRVEGILETGELHPQRQPLLNLRLVWLTHSPKAKAAALGLASRVLLTCDRMEYLFEVTEPRAVVHWSVLRPELPRTAVQALEAAHGARPGMWWVSGEPQPIRLVVPA